MVGRKAGVQPERRRATVLWVGHLDPSRQAIYQLLHLVRVRVEGLGLGGGVRVWLGCGRPPGGFPPRACRVPSRGPVSSTAG